MFLLFMILMFVVFGKMFRLAIRATWGITKILFTIVFLPLILIGMVFSGLLSVAFIVLIVIGIGSLLAVD